MRLVVLGFVWYIAWAELINIDHWVPRVSSVDKDLPRCELPARSGQLVGVCKDVETMQLELSFCRDSVCYTACVPPAQPLWPQWTVQSKDKLLGDLFKKTVESRIFREMTLAKTEDVTVRFSQNLACIDAYKNALCWYNFPKCGCGESLVMCRSVCLNYYKACGFTTASATVFPECEDVLLREWGLFSSYRLRDAATVGNTLPVVEHALVDPTVLKCSAGRRLQDRPNSTADAKFVETVTPRALSEITIQGWGYTVGGVTGPNSPVALITVAALWEIVGVTIIVLMTYSPRYWEKGRSLLLPAFGLLTICGMILIALQINALRVPPARATDQGPATVRCPTEEVYAVPESCATVFTMDQLNMMSCHSCTGGSIRFASSMLLAVLI